MAILCRQELDLFGFRFEKRVYGLLRVFDDKSFFLRTGFMLLALRLWLFRHTLVLSSRFLFGGMPQPGIEPGSPKWAPACKAGPFAISSTGAQIALDGGT